MCTCHLYIHCLSRPVPLLLSYWLAMVQIHTRLCCCVEDDMSSRTYANPQQPYCYTVEHSPNRMPTCQRTPLADSVRIKKICIMEVINFHGHFISSFRSFWLGSVCVATPTTNNVLSAKSTEVLEICKSSCWSTTSGNKLIRFLWIFHIRLGISFQEKSSLRKTPPTFPIMRCVTDAI